MFEVISSDVKLGMFESAQVKDKDKDRDFKMTLQKPIVVCGDICVDFFHKPPRLGKKVNHTRNWSLGCGMFETDSWPWLYI